MVRGWYQFIVKRLGLVAGICLVLFSDHAMAQVFDVRAHGAVGDGITDETAVLNEVIQACAAAGGGQVLFPPGTYLSGTLHLRSHIALVFEAGAVLKGTPDLTKYQFYTPPADTAEAGYGAWHSALILGVGVENVSISGAGLIDGNKLFNPKGEERMRGPHTLLFGDSQHITIRDVDIADAANYAIMIEHSHQVEVRGVKCTGGWDGVHFRGWKDRPCQDIRIVGCQFYTGDDSIAGRYAEQVLIQDCVINTSCNGIRIIGPLTSLIIHDCLFYGPGQYPHRTQDRHNMLAGILLQPGGWDRCEGILEDVLISDVTMKEVACPIAITLKREGNQAKDITIEGVTASGVYHTAFSVESWIDTPVERVSIRNCSLEYRGGETQADRYIQVEKPGTDTRPLPAWGFYARHVADLRLESVRFNTRNQDVRPVLWSERVDGLRLDGIAYPEPEGEGPAFFFKETEGLKIRNVARPKEEGQ
ncbi:MAG: glycosyl hydrolase family 28-related protein [bacterium]|jgi:hypothetical protein|nr:glycosyl hydrolase family 28-related protein [bacterium]